MYVVCECCALHGVVCVSDCMTDELSKSVQAHNIGFAIVWHRRYAVVLYIFLKFVFDVLLPFKFQYIDCQFFNLFLFNISMQVLVCVCECFHFDLQA